MLEQVVDIGGVLIHGVALKALAGVAEATVIGGDDLEGLCQLGDVLVKHLAGQEHAVEENYGSSLAIDLVKNMGTVRCAEEVVFGGHRVPSFLFDKSKVYGNAP